MLRRPIRAALAACALLLPAATAAPALADIQPVPAPGSGPVFDAAAAGDTWLAVTPDPNSGDPLLWRTGDGGAGWSAVALDDHPQNLRLAVGPDGAFYLAESFSGAAGRLLRLAPGDAAPTVVAAGIGSGSDLQLAPPSWDASGALWEAWSAADDQLTSYAAHVGRVEGGAFTEVGSGPLQGTPSASWAIDAAHGAVTVDDGTATSVLSGSALVAAAGAVGLPVLEDHGILFYASGATSTDGGRTIGDDTAAGYVPVRGAPDLLVAGDQLLARFSPALFTATGTVLPGSPMSAWATRGGVLLRMPPGTDAGTLQFATAGRPPAAIGEAPPGSRAMVDRANAIRRASGLPPLADDARIAQAAAAHSAYWAHRAGPGNPLALHEETPGTPGFTGAAPWDRCAAAGTDCAAEVMYPGKSGAAAADGWAATVFHGGLMLNPLEWRAGGATSGRGPAVMDLGASAGLITAPVPFPAGRYLGARQFFGEAPDPAAACAKAGRTRIRAPFGPTVFLWLPGDARPESIVVRRAPHGAPLRGCLLGSGFLLDDAVRPRTRYAVSARWKLGAGPEQALSWSFGTAAG